MKVFYDFVKLNVFYSVWLVLMHESGSKLIENSDNSPALLQAGVMT